MELIAHRSQHTVTNDDVVRVALEGDIDAVSVNRRHGTRGAHLLSQQRTKRRAQQSDGMGVFVAGTFVHQPVGLDSSSDGLGDEFHRHWPGCE